MPISVEEDWEAPSWTWTLMLDPAGIFWPGAGNPMATRWAKTAEARMTSAKMDFIVKME